MSYRFAPTLSYTFVCDRESGCDIDDKAYMEYKHRIKRTNRVSVYEEFCVEMDLFSDNQPYPDWVFDFREEHLSKISSKLINFCRKLKAANVEFKILYPMQIFGKWKFADVYIPKHKVVVIVTTYPHSAAWLTERARFFQDRCRVYELDGYESEGMINEIIDKLK